MVRWLGVNKPTAGTRHEDAIAHVLSVCQACGILTHRDSYSQRDIDDVTPTRDVQIGPKTIRYGFAVAANRREAFLRLSGAIAAAMNIDVERVAIVQEGAVYWVQVVRPDADNTVVRFEDLLSCPPVLAEGAVILGLDVRGVGLTLDLTDPTVVHAAVVSTTGGGKTALMRAMILSALLLSHTHVAIFDPKGDKEKGFWPMSGHPLAFMRGMFHTLPDCERGLAALAQRIKRVNRPHPATLVFVDEADYLVSESERCRDLLVHIAKTGRGAGLHLVIGAQDLSVGTIGGGIVRQCQARLVGHVADPQVAATASGRRRTGAETLRGRGQFVCVRTGHPVRQFQAPWVSPDWVRKAFPYHPAMAHLPTVSGARDRILTTRDVAPQAGGNGAHGDGGRTFDEIPAWVLADIRAYQSQNGEPPSLRWVNRLTGERLPTGGYGRAKAQRAIDDALEGVM